jgi:tripartite-type tricarboxylate transporter receptor subunit TctC
MRQVVPHFVRLFARQIVRPVAPRPRFAIAALAVAITAGTVGALAQTYPSRVIKIIVPFSPGGQPDVVARVFAQHLATTVGPNIIDNRPGNNTITGAKVAAGSAPDGYSLLFGSTSSLAIAPALTANAGYDPVKDFAPIVGISSSPMYLTVGPSVPAKSVAEFVAYAKANPGKLNFAAPTGGPPHLAGEIFKRAAGIEMTPVFYRTMNQAFTDMLAGQMDIIFDSPAALAHLLREGRIRALVSMGAKRTTELPDVPTMGESGLPEVRVVTWNGFVAPAGTPDAIIKRLNAAVNDALMSTNTRETLDKFGSQPIGGSPQEFADFVAAESKKWTDIIRLAGVKID